MSYYDKYQLFLIICLLAPWKEETTSSSNSGPCFSLNVSSLMKCGHITFWISSSLYRNLTSRSLTSTDRCGKKHISFYIRHENTVYSLKYAHVFLGFCFALFVLSVLNFLCNLQSTKKWFTKYPWTNFHISVVSTRSIGISYYIWLFCGWYQLSKISVSWFYWLWNT